MAFGRLITIVQHFDCGMPTLVVSSRSSRGLSAVSFSQLTVSSQSVHGRLAASVNVLYLHLNVSVNTNGQAYVTGRPSGRWYSSGEVWKEK